MGDWNITIRGTGAHHNENYKSDANRMAKRFVEMLREAGHSVRAASFTHGGEDALAGGQFPASNDPPTPRPSPGRRVWEEFEKHHVRITGVTRYSVVHWEDVSAAEKDAWEAAARAVLES